MDLISPIVHVRSRPDQCDRLDEEIERGALRRNENPWTDLPAFQVRFEVPRHCSAVVCY